MDKLNIPKTIHVGYQNRSDTYTGKLAYVIYTDEKGKRRKETSWESWRSNKITPDDYANEPTSGFVLNRNGGGGCRGWDARNEFIRVFDPRGFEFEIGLANLLFILQECTSTKGKGLEGEFVYSWEGTGLVLLPVGCQEYKQSMEFTAMKSMKVTKTDMKEGLVYQHKDTRDLIYLGRHKIRDLNSVWGGEAIALIKTSPDTFKHIFYDPGSKSWEFERGFTKLARIVSDDPHPEFADLYTKFTSSHYVSEFDKVVLKPVKLEAILKNSHWGTGWFYIQVPEGYQQVRVGNWPYNRHYHSWDKRNEPDEHGMTHEMFWPTQPVVIKDITEHAVVTEHHNGNGTGCCYHVSKKYLESLEDPKFFTLKLKLKSNKTVEIYDYVK